LNAVEHPAKFSLGILQRIQDYVYALPDTLFSGVKPIRILDPMAGVGTIHRLAVPGSIETVGLEIEPEWAEQHPDTIEGDATAMPFETDSFHIVCFSPPYGNRMADQFVSKDGTRRMTYYHTLGRRLHENSAAGMQWGDQYTKTMTSILIQCKRVCRSEGLIIINVSDHIRNREIIPVVQWYRDAMHDLGYKLLDDIKIETQRMRFGANHKLRVDFEHILVFRLRRF